MENRVTLKEFPTFSKMVEAYKNRTGAVVPEISKGKTDFFSEFSYWLSNANKANSPQEINAKIFPDPIQGLALPNANEILGSAFRISGKENYSEQDITKKLEEYGLRPEMLNQPVMTYSGGELLLLNFARSSIMAKISQCLIACSPVYWLNQVAFPFWEKLVKEFVSNQKTVEVYLLQNEKYPGRKPDPMNITLNQAVKKNLWQLSEGSSLVCFPEVHFPVYFPEKTLQFKLEAGQAKQLISPTLITGENGIGKSTFVKKLAGIIKGEGAGVNFTEKAETRLVFQSSIKQLFGKSPQEHLCWAFQFDETLKEKAKNLFFKLKNAYLDKIDKDELDSIATAKFLLIAERLASDPDFLILDEPGWGFSFENGINFLLTVLNVSNEIKTSIIIISHQVAVLRQICKSEIKLHRTEDGFVGVEIEVY